MQLSLTLLIVFRVNRLHKFPLQALALGADGVLVGRPIIFALALGGKDAITRALGILKKEFELSLALMGCSSIRDLRRSHVILPRQLPARL